MPKYSLPTPACGDDRTPLQRDYEAVIENMTEQLGAMWEQLQNINGSVNGILDDPDEYPDIPKALEAAKKDSDSYLMTRFNNDEPVRVTLWSSGKIWPRGPISRTGKILKRGNTAYAYLVILDEPLGEDQVLNMPHYCISALND